MTLTKIGTVRTSTLSVCTSPLVDQKSATSSPDFDFAVTCTNPASTDDCGTVNRYGVVVSSATCLPESHSATETLESSSGVVVFAANVRAGRSTGAREGVDR